MASIEIFGQDFDLDNPQSTYFHGDCMEGMAKFPDKYFDLAVVDPPYGIGQSGGKMGTDKLAVNRQYKHFAGDDVFPPDKRYFGELFRVSQKQILFGANHYLDNIPEPRNSSCWIVWDKDNGGNSFADAELAWTNEEGAVRMFKFKWAGMLQGNMKHKEHRIHPTQKPVELYNWIFGRYAERGMKILDTHVGSASSLIAAHDAGLMYVGFELDDYYYEASKKRLDMHMAQIILSDFLLPDDDEPPAQMNLFDEKEEENKWM